jgi:hypothetical protein
MRPVGAYWGHFAAKKLAISTNSLIQNVLGLRPSLPARSAHGAGISKATPYSGGRPNKANRGWAVPKGWLISAACPTLQTALPLRRFAILLDPETTLQQRGALQPISRQVIQSSGSFKLLQLITFFISDNLGTTLDTIVKIKNASHIRGILTSNFGWHDACVQSFIALGHRLCSK